MAKISKETAKRNIAKNTGLTGAKLDRAATKFVRKQRGRAKKK